jgi:heme exporter protein A
MSGSVSIGFEGVAKRYDARVIFKGVSGDAVPGRILVITGPNGSGKSTLVRILCGLARPTVGRIEWRLGREPPMARDEWRRHLGVVAPAMSVYEELTAMENLQFFARVRGLGPMEPRCRECLEQVGLDPDRQTQVMGFSTGMVQRLKIAQAMLHDPPVLMFDEPGSNLDPTGQDWLEGFTRSAADDGRTIVLATNDRCEMTWGDDRVELAG